METGMSTGSASYDPRLDDDYRDSAATASSEVIGGVEYDATWSAQLIKEAMANMRDNRQLSAYERRVALREVKDIIKGLIEDWTDPLQNVGDMEKTVAYLRRSENEDTKEQLVYLHQVMIDMMRNNEKLEAQIRSVCIKIRDVWNAHDYDANDVFEARIRSGGSGIQPSRIALEILLDMYESWMDFADRLELEAEDRKRLEAELPLKEKEMRDRLHVLLTACNVPAKVSDDLLHSRFENSFGQKSDTSARRLAELGAFVARLAQAMPKYSEVLKQAQEMGRMPRPGTDFDATEEWIEKARRLKSSCKVWELMSGISFFASLGPAFFCHSSTAASAPASAEKRQEDEQAEEKEKKGADLNQPFSVQLEHALMELAPQEFADH